MASTLISLLAFSVPCGTDAAALIANAAAPIANAAAPTANAAAPTDNPQVSLFGYTAEESKAEQSLERRFDSDLDPADLSAWMKKLSSEANQVGSSHDKANAEFVRDQLEQWGWDARIEVFYPLYPTLKQHLLELVAPTRFVAALEESPVAGDATSSRTDGMGPYNVYGADGDVTGDLVYVNYGMPDDYKELARRGIDVKGRIVITRYGEGWRGLKPKLAQEHGALACIIYSDPQGDGYVQGDVYPKGGWRPDDGVQRGSVGDITVYPGDPLTPGVAATKDAKRLSLAEAKTLMKIPVIPISYGDAQPLLAALTGPVAPKAGRGALPITYHMGPGPARVHLAISSDWGQKPLYDVIARIRGSQKPDEWIVRGNHRDGWVFGAWDPLSGHVDTVPVDGQSWGSDPFTLRAEGGKLYGRGTADMKGFVASCLAAIPDLQAAKLSRPVHLFISYDEEVSCNGARRLIEDIAESGWKPDLCLVGEPSLLQPITGHKGRLAMRVTARTSARGSTPKCQRKCRSSCKSRASTNSGLTSDRGVHTRYC